MKVTGTVSKIIEAQSGTSKAGKDWKKQTFVLETEEKYNNVYPFEVFGEDKIEELISPLKEGDQVEVSFNVNAREWQGRYFVDLSAWKVDLVEGEFQETKENLVKQSEETTAGDDTDLPF